MGEELGEKIKKALKDMFSDTAMLITAIIGLLIGYISSGIKCGLATALYGIMIYTFGSSLSLVPVAGALLVWYWLMPALHGIIYGSTGIAPPPSPMMLMYNIYLIIPAILVNIIITAYVVLKVIVD